MISLKVLSAVAVMALVLPMAAPSASFAAPPGKGGPGVGGGRAAGGGGNFRGAAPAARFNGGGAPGPRFSGGGGGRPWHGGNGGGGGGFIPGAIAGAVIGGAIASQGGYGGPVYAPGYYDDPAITMAALP